ncbi:DNA-directed RNA polymerase III subunit RPC9-like [Mytilus edulis]|uniref:DNA-directed RNA polymerase III subunit RPC9 n=1 Tax=Mytilus galloprovincialis TaxID=29158 RepID=A0A8B6DUB9_MYTGA|nr:Hypothetical predicted protein [Mytilus galloprovincialis]
MEVKNDNSAILSNYEVLQLLSDIHTGRGQIKPNKHQKNLATITYETVKYLENTPCKNQSPELIQNIMTDLQAFNLTKAEKLQILNQCPTSAVEIQLIIEESEERLTEDQIYQLLEIITKYNVTKEASNAGDEEMEDEDDSVEQT